MVLAYFHAYSYIEREKTQSKFISIFSGSTRATFCSRACDTSDIILCGFSFCSGTVLPAQLLRSWVRWQNVIVWFAPLDFDEKVIHTNRFSSEWQRCSCVSRSIDWTIRTNEHIVNEPNALITTARNDVRSLIIDGNSKYIAIKQLNIEQRPKRVNGKKLRQTSAYEWSHCIRNTLIIATTSYRTPPTHIWRWIIPSSIISFWSDVAKAKQEKLLVSDIGSWRTSLFSVPFGRSTFHERRQDENLVWLGTHTVGNRCVGQFHFYCFTLPPSPSLPPLCHIAIDKMLLCRLPLIEIRCGTCALCDYTATMLRVRAHCLRNRSKCLFMLHLLAIHVFPHSVQFSFWCAHAQFR